MATRRTLSSTLLALVLLAVVALGAGRAQVIPRAPAVWRLLPATLSSTRYYGEIACVGPSRCWVPFGSRSGGGAGVLATDDGGSAWSVEHLPGHATYLPSISCGTTSECLVVGYSGVLGRRSAGVAFRTVDGGGSWSQLTLPAPVGPGVDNQLFSVSCRGTGWCAAVGGGFLPKTSSTPPSCGPGCTEAPTGQASTGPVTLTTADAGTAWSVSALPMTSGAQMNGTSCGAPGACQTVGFAFTDCHPRSGGGVECGPAAAAGGSLDGGRRWVSEPVGGGIFNLYSVSCPTAAQCWATGSTGNDVQGHGVILHTSDGGAQWVHEAPVPGSNSLTGVSCPTVRSCVAVGALGTAAHLTPVVETTSDGGARWIAGPVPEPVSEIVLVTCVAPGRCLAEGIEGYGQSERAVLLAG